MWRTRLPSGARSLRRLSGQSLLIFASIMLFLMLFAVASLSFMTSTDLRTSFNLARERRATALAESIAIQLEARASRHPWNSRFWLREAQLSGNLFPAKIDFSKGSGHVDLSLEDLAPSSYDFVGIIKDVDVNLKQYRITVEVTLDDESFVFTFDRQYQEDLLGGMNRESSLLDKQWEDAPPDQGDAVVRAVEDSAKSPPDTLSQQLRDQLQQLEQDNMTFEGTAGIVPQPSNQPPPPP